jgi:formate dehydrogenase maturation protein FdhE
VERELTHDWGRAIARARTLARSHDAASSLLSFYAGLLDAQATVFRQLRAGSEPPAPALDRNLAAIRPLARGVLTVVASGGPQLLADEARRFLEGDDDMVRLKPDTTDRPIDDALLEYWRAPDDRQFFAKAILQPYGRWLAECGVTPEDRPLARAGNRCPFCGGSPQVSVLHDAGELQGGGRMLLCATCLTTWAFPRVVCAFCGEEDDRKLGYFHTPDFDHLRVDGCESCRRYIKSVDLTRLGLAVPLVDEVAGAPLDLWARDHGYEKIELNLVGL